MASVLQNQATIQGAGFSTPAFGEGRSRGLKYFHYSTTDRRRILSKPVEDNRGVEVQFDGNEKFSWRKLWLYTGPGWLMSIAYLDPGNLESDLQAGFGSGYQLIWVLWWATFLGWIVQSLSARLGTVTGLHLAELCRYEYGRATSLSLWIFTELAIIGSDIQEVVGSAIAMKILFGWPLYVGCLVTAADTFTFMLVHWYGVRKLEMIFTTLIGVMVVTFSVEFGLAKPDGGQIMKGWIVPECDGSASEYAVAMIGAVIMPHNLFLHSALVQSRQIDRTKRGAVAEANFYFTLEGAISLLVSFYINLTIMAVFATGDHFHFGDDIGLRDAGEFLMLNFGKSAKYIWAVGLLAAGQSSTMTGTFAGQYAMQGFLDIQWAPWKRTMLTRSIALGPSLLFALKFADNMDKLNEWLNVQQSVQLPFAIIPLLVFNCNPRIMGDFRLKGWKEGVMWLATLAIIAINIYLAIQQMTGMFSKTPTFYAILTIILVVYVVFCMWITWDGLFRERWRGSPADQFREPLLDHAEGADEAQTAEDVARLSLKPSGV